jgi:hypothetical protein
MAAAPKITLDTNCIINLFDVTAKTPTSVTALTRIVKEGFANRADIAITTRVEADLLNDKDPDRKAAMLKMLDLLPVVGTVGRWGTTTWDSGDFWGSDKTAKLALEIQNVIFPGLLPSDRRYRNKQMDVDHLVGHLINGREIFVTDDSGILSKRDALKRSPGLLVMSPDECIAHLESIHQLQVRKPLDATKSDSRYRSPLLRGSATFDYSNNNGNFAFGDGIFLFETKWSKASNTSIHAYSDAPSIEGLAIAKNAPAISDVSDATALDFSSKVRSPQLGQIVIWRNVNGIYAATRITDIKDDKRGAANDELSFEFVVQPDGSASFIKL